VKNIEAGTTVVGNPAKIRDTEYGKSGIRDTEYGIRKTERFSGGGGKIGKL